MDVPLLAQPLLPSSSSSTAFALAAQSYGKHAIKATVPAASADLEFSSSLRESRSDGGLVSAAAVVGAAAAAAATVGARRRHKLRKRYPSSVVVAASVSRGDGTDKAPGRLDVFDTVVIGGGVSGLTAGHRILKDMPGANLIVTEARDRVGGNITTCTGNGRIWEEGPNSFQPGDAILTVACDVGLQDDIVLADPNSYRFVWWEGALRALPATPADAVFGDFLSLPGKIRAGLGAIGLLKDPMPETEETVKDFVTRNLGEEAFQRLIDPFVSGVYAGDPATLSAEAATGRVQVLEKNGGSLVAGAIQLFQDRAKESKEKPPRDPRLPEVKGQTVGSFRKGLVQFADALTADLEKGGCPIKLQWKLKSLKWDAAFEQHVLEYETPEGMKTLRSKSIVLTAPSYVTAELLRPLSSAAAEALSEIKYPCVAAVTVEYPKSALRAPAHGKGPVNGFGQLHPRTQGIRTLGTIYSSSLFPGRQPDPDKVMLLHYIGGMQDQKLFGGISEMSEGELVEATHKDTVTTMLHPTEVSNLPNALGVRTWQRAIPQLEVGHAKRLERTKKGLADAGIKGVYLAGNYVGGVALGRCVEFGIEVAEEVCSFVKSKQSQYAS
eukprot:TRINITY_DN66188_c0_g1_i1.p1 TRINITY_DN66188_c0_g1~~TRINITY_DN66188_c0_g1_i1.p1  ORF type:complete len:609 (-),score=135.42 TRINITY_DN66188_c0_g1_i1:179-2005(-)